MTSHTHICVHQFIPLFCVFFSQNVFVAQDGAIKLGDFGLAKPLGGDSGTTAAAAAAATTANKPRQSSTATPNPTTTTTTTTTPTPIPTTTSHSRGPALELQRDTRDSRILSVICPPNGGGGVGLAAIAAAAGVGSVDDKMPELEDINGASWSSSVASPATTATAASSDTASSDTAATTSEEIPTSEIDLELRHLIMDTHTGGVGTMSWAAPEQIQGEQYNSSADIFSLGLILCELHCCFATAMERAGAFKDIRNVNTPRVPVELTARHPDVADLVLACTRSDPSLRPTASDIIRCDLLNPHQAELRSLREGLADRDAIIERLQQALAEDSDKY
jgi:serine/threonine protein kinase